MRKITRVLVLEALRKHEKPVSAKELATELAVYDRWNEVEECLEQLVETHSVQFEINIPKGKVRIEGRNNVLQSALKRCGYFSDEGP